MIVTKTTGTSSARSVEQPLERFNVHVALERMQCRRVAALRDRQVECLRPGVLDVGPRRVEVRVVGDDLPRPTEHREQDPLRRPALVGRDHVLEREQLLHRLEEAKPRRRARVALVTVLDRSPLVARHRTGARVGEEVDQHLVRGQLEEVEVDRRHGRAPLLLGRQPQRLHGVDPERLDDRLEAQAVIDATSRRPAPDRPRPARTTSTRSARRRARPRTPRA